jgi:hypothetical protein
MVYLKMLFICTKNFYTLNTKTNKLKLNGEIIVIFKN